MMNILWIHGWGQSSAIWQEDHGLLPEYRHHDVSFAHCTQPAHFLEEVCNCLGRINAPTVVVGWSMGGLLALELFLNPSLRERYKIVGAVVVAGTLQFVSDDRRLGWPERIVNRMRKQLRERQDDVLKQFAQAMFSEAETGGIATNKVTSMTANNDVTATTNVLLGVTGDQANELSIDSLDTGLRYLMETDLRKLWLRYVAEEEASPLLWVHGTEDTICPPGCIPEEIRSQAFVLEGAGHAPFLTRKAHFYDRLRSFLHEAASYR